MSRRPVTFHCEGVQLEGVMHAVAPGEESARCVVTHPHPLYGGSMDNNVVWALCEELPRVGIGALCFNFRGVGGSTGRYSEGTGEAKDLAAAVSFCAEGFGGPVFVAGYSFGAYVACLAAETDPGFSALAIVSPPVDMMDVAFPPPALMPLLVVAGDRDMFCSVERLRDALQAGAVPQIIEGADHFWLGSEPDMAGAVAGFFLGLTEKE